MIRAWRTSDRFGHPEVFALIALASWAVARFVPVLAFSYQCPMKALAGIPCATCGMTHAFVHLAHGSIAAALDASPLGALLAAGAWAYGLADLARFAAGAPLPVPREGVVRGATVLAVAALIANWAWLVARGVQHS